MSLCHWHHADTGKRGEHGPWEKQSFVFSFLGSVPGEAEEMKSGVVTSDQAVLTARRTKKLAQTPQPGIHLA